MKKEIEVTFGTGTNKTELAAFDAALFDAGSTLYRVKYGISPDGINGLEKLVFEMGNPFQTI